MGGGADLGYESADLGLGPMPGFMPFFGGPFMAQMPPFLAGFGLPGMNGLMMPWGPLTATSPSAPTQDIYVGGDSDTGGGNYQTSNPFSENYVPRWPQSNVFLAEIKGWERAVPAPENEADPDPLRWIWKYKWEEVGRNYIWPGHAQRTWTSNPGMQGNMLEQIYAYNGCEYPNWAEQTNDPATEDRRVFFGPFGRNLEEASDQYLPFPENITDSTQGWQDWEMFSDFVNENLIGSDNSLPIWDGNFQPAIKVGQPLPIGHHNKDQYYGTLYGGDATLDHTDFSVAMPNVHVLMMERWIKKDDLPSGLTDPGWCPDCSSGGTTGNENVVPFDGVDYVCSYWFYATNARFDLPWVPGKDIAPEVGELVKTTVDSAIPGVPNYAWQSGANGP